MTNRNTFMLTYVRNLALVVTNYPEEYQWNDTSLGQVAIVAEKMFAAMDRGGYNKDSRAYKATCKELGIKHTYTAIDAYWKG
jgi:hypothetical protein